tara:strand:+ start:525 stop:1172 length:648 start_codon:yes stop_codon:yes gene_type:complete
MKVEVYIPDTLSEITLGQYQKYLKLQEDNTNENRLATQMIEIFCGLRNETIMAMKANSIKDITMILTDMFNDKPPLVKEFKMNGVSYGFIPKVEDMSFGEYIDLDTFIGDYQNLHRAMNVLYRPIKLKDKEKYLIEDYDSKDPDVMKGMPMDAVLSSILFFYNLGMDLSKAMLNYLEDNEMNLAQYLTSEQNGDGINHFSDSLKEILDDLKISLN